MKSLFKKLVSFSIGPIGVAALGFLLTTAVTHIISPEEYGRTGMFQTVQSLVSVFTLLALDQAYAREYVLADGEKGESLLVSAMALPLALSLTFSAALVLFRGWAGEFLFGSPAESTAILLTAVTFPCMIVERFCLMRVRMGEQGLLYSALTLLLKILTLVLAVPMLLYFEQSFRSVVYAMAIAQILSSAASAAVVLRKIPAGTRPDRAVISGLLKYALPLVPATMIAWIYTSSDQLMLRTLSGYGELGLYTAAFKIVAVVSILQTCFTTLWSPVAFRWYETKKSPVYFDTVMWAVGLLSTGAGLGLLLCKDLVALVLGKGFRQSIAIFPFLLLSPVMYTMSEASTVGIPFSRKTGYNVAVTAVTAAVNVLLNFTLIPFWGGRGAAIATGLSYLAFFWARTLISRKLWRPFPLAHFITDCLVLTFNCWAHSFLAGPAPYLISAASIGGMILLNIPQMKKVWTLLRRLDS